MRVLMQTGGIMGGIVVIMALSVVFLALSLIDVCLEFVGDVVEADSGKAK